jgi:uncharacterized membrane protein
MIGAVIGWVLRRLRSWAEWSTGDRRRWAWRALTGVGLIAAAIGLVLWLAWQNDHRDLVNLDGLPVWHVIPMVIATALVFLILLFFGRLVAWFACRIERFTQRFIQTWAAMTATALVIVLVSDLVVGCGTDPGFGHNHATEFVEGWAAVAAPDGWTAEDTARLRGFLEPLQ